MPCCSRRRRSMWFSLGYDVSVERQHLHYVITPSTSVTLTFPDHRHHLFSQAETFSLISYALRRAYAPGSLTTSCLRRLAPPDSPDSQHNAPVIPPPPPLHTPSHLHQTLPHPTDAPRPLSRIPGQPLAKLTPPSRRLFHGHL